MTQLTSLSPLPVTVMTIRLSFGSFPSFCFLIKPAMPAADEGSTKIPSFAETKRYAVNISSSVTPGGEQPNKTTSPYRGIFSYGRKTQSYPNYARSYFLTKDSNFKYYITPTVSLTGSNTVYTNASTLSIRYKNSFSMNKLVIKANMAENYITNTNYTIYYLNEQNNWVEFDFEDPLVKPTFDSEGNLVLYYINSKYYSQNTWFLEHVIYSKNFK